MVVKDDVSSQTAPLLSLCASEFQTEVSGVRSWRHLGLLLAAGGRLGPATGGRGDCVHGLELEKPRAWMPLVLHLQ